MKKCSKCESNSRGALPIIALVLVSFVWITFLLALTSAILGGREAGCWFPSVIVHLFGVLLLPILVLVSSFRSSQLRRTLLTLTGIYLVTTLWIYPQVVKQYLKTHPGTPGLHWDKGSWCDYQYIEDNPVGDPQYSGQVCLFPPYFDIPSE